MYILPAIDILGGQVVRLAKGEYSQVTVYDDNPLEQARTFEKMGATWVHVVDLDGAKTGNPANISLIEKIGKHTQLNVEVGGGVRDIETIERLQQAGVARVVLGTSLVRDPEFAQASIEKFGSLLAAGIDAKAGEVAVEGWCEGSGISTEALIRKIADMGFENLIYTDISRDGMQTGIDENAYVEIANIFGRPVIASGGLAGADDIRRLVKVADSIEGVIAGRALYEGSLDLVEAIRLCSQENN